MKHFHFVKRIEKHFDEEKKEMTYTVLFDKVPGRHVPSFGLEKKEAHLLYVDIANCKRCKFGMVPNIICRDHHPEG